jgi:hypothetical protein
MKIGKVTVLFVTESFFLISQKKIIFDCRVFRWSPLKDESMLALTYPFNFYMLIV